MKSKFSKIVSLLLAMCMLFACAACDNNPSSVNSGNSDVGNDDANILDIGGVSGTDLFPDIKAPEGGKDTKVRDLKGREITVMAFWAEDTKGASASANLYWKNKEELEKKYNCKINFVFKSTEYIDGDVATSILAGKPKADVFWTKNVYQLYKKGVIQPLSDFKQLDFTEEKWSYLIKEKSTINGKVYGMYAGIDVRRVLYYNKTYFKNNNLPDLFELQKSGKFTWDKFREIAKKATKGNVKGFIPYMDASSVIPFFINANGGLVVSRGKGTDFKVTINSKAALNAIEFWTDMRNNDGSVLTDTTGKNWDYAITAFEQGLVAMSYATTGAAQNVDFEVGMVLFPGGPDSPYPYFSQGEGTMMCMAAGIKNPEEVALVMDQYLGSDTNTISWQDSFYDMYYSEEILETIKLGENAFKSGKINMGEYNGVTHNIYNNDIASLMKKMEAGQITPAQGLESCESVLQAYVNAFNK